jgi:hypothetical protein
VGVSHSYWPHSLGYDRSSLAPHHNDLPIVLLCAAKYTANGAVSMTVRASDAASSGVVLNAVTQLNQTILEAFDGV